MTSSHPSALIQAVTANDVPRLTAAIAAGADLEEATIVGFLEGQTPLDMALSKGHVEVARALDAAGAPWPAPERTEWLLRQSEPLQALAQQMQTPTVEGASTFEGERTRFRQICAFAVEHQPLLGATLAPMMAEVDRWSPAAPAIKTGWFRRMRR